MSWAKVDDGWWCHPKVMGLGKGGRSLWVSALSWSCAQRQATIPPRLLVMVGNDEDDAAELVAAGLWDALSDDGWQIHDWSEYQEQSLSEKRAEAGSKGGKRSAATRAKGKQTPSKPDLLDEANGQAGPSLPGPSRPVPSDTETSGKSQSEEPPAADDAEAQPEQDPEQAARKALNIYAHTKAASEARGDPSALAASIGRSAVDDGRLDLLREWVAAGLDPDEAALRLLDPFSLGGEGASTGGPPSLPAAESTHPLLRPVPTFCADDSCDDGWVDTPSGAVARCPKCNADPIGAVS